MPSWSAETALPRSRRRRWLAIGGAAIFLLLATVEVLTIRAWTNAHQSTVVFSDRVYEITDLANIQRQVLHLALTVELLDEGASMRDVRVDHDLLHQQLRVFVSPGYGADAPDALAEVLAHLGRLDAALDGVDDVTGPTNAQRAVIREHLDELDLAVKELYDNTEIPYFDELNRALGDRADSSLLALWATGLLGLFALLYVIAVRRAARADQTEAYDALRSSEEHHRRVVNSVKDVIFTTDQSGAWTFLSRAWRDLTGTSVEDSLGRNFIEWVHPDDVDSCVEKFRSFFASNAEEALHETRYVRADGGVAWVEIWVRRTEAGTAGTVVDVTDRRRFSEQLQHQAHHDPLTGLANRDLLSVRLEEAVTDLERSGSQAGIVFFDLDGFKLINDSLGHDAGDLLLCEVAERIGEQLRPGDTAARLGGDEFVVICRGLDGHPNVAMNETRRVSRRIEAAVAEPFVIDGRRLHVTTSAGITLARTDVRVDQLISEADAAMYRAKELGKSRHQVFDSELRDAADLRLRLESELRDAVEQRQFVLHHQPIADARTGAVVGAEALLRWQHPSRGLLAPHAFLEVAESAGLMPAIGAWVLDRACADLAVWRERAEAPPNLSMSVNLSPRELAARQTLRTILEALDRYGLPPEALCVEVTEHHIIDGSAAVTRHLEELDRLGIRVALDDFGTGYSSLSYLRRLPISELKIDRSFIEQIGAETADDTIVEVMVELASGLGLVTVAEGIELPSQLRHLQALGVDRVQGYLVGKPVDADAFARDLSRGLEVRRA